MLANIAITILLLLLQFDAHAEGPSDNITNPKDMTSIDFYNQAVEHFSANKLGSAKAFTEHSLYLNPFNSPARKLNIETLDRLSEQNGSVTTESISELYTFLDFIPAIFIYVILFMFSTLLVIRLTKLVFLERSTFTTQSNARMQCTLLFAAIISLFLLHLTKQQSLSEPWACITTPQAGLYTGPSEKNFVQTTALQEGSCAQVIKAGENWVSLKPRSKASGWAKRKDLLILRGSKFDPLFNKD